MTASNYQSLEKSPTFEWRMIANIAMGAIAAGLAVLLVFISLWPAERKKLAADAATAAPAS